MTVREITLQANGLQLAAKAWGDPNGRKVLALHGWLDNAASFDVLAPMLTDIELVALDLPGHGLSEHRPSGAHYYVWEYVHDVLAVADALKWQRFSLLGHSLGAAVAVLTAGSSERIEKLGLIEAVGPLTTPELEAPEQLSKAIKMSDKFSPQRKTVYDSFELALQARINGGFAITEAAARLLVDRGLMKNDQGFVWRADPRLRLLSMLRMSEAQALAFLQKIQTPVCLVCDPVDGYVQAFDKSRQDAIAQLQVHEFSGGHHLHMADHTSAIATVLNQFFNQ